MNSCWPRALAKPSCSRFDPKGVTMTAETLFRRGTTLVRRLRLAPGEMMPWHRDPFHRVTVVLSGDAIAIEYRDGGSLRFEVSSGQVDWDEPTDRIHRGVNVG